MSIRLPWTLLMELDVQMELDASISAKRFDISKLSKDSLEALKIDIQQRLALEREDPDVMGPICE